MLAIKLYFFALFGVIFPVAFPIIFGYTIGVLTSPAFARFSSKLHLKSGVFSICFWAVLAVGLVTWHTYIQSFSFLHLAGVALFVASGLYGDAAVAGKKWARPVPAFFWKITSGIANYWRF